MNIFDTITNRRGTFSAKWDEDPTPGMLPMWVADMDFQTAPSVIEAVQERAKQGIFGYVHPTITYYTSLIAWFRRRYGWTFKYKWVIYTSGVVPAISAIIKAMTKPGDHVLIQTPVYNCFFSSIRNNGCVAEESHLIYEDNTYHIDFDDFERRCSKPEVKVFLLCNPHNPTGRVWTADELKRMGDICMRHGVFVIADEIHCDLTMPEYKYTPFASLSEEFLMHCAVCNSPSKSFNIAGLQIANIVAADTETRRRIDRAINDNEVCDIGTFGPVALMAAYDFGEQWLEELRVYLKGNYDFLCQYVSEYMPMLKVTKLEGTYLVWINCAALGKPAREITDELRHTVRLWLNEGDIYGEHDIPFIRMNIACQKATLKDGLFRLKEYIRRLPAQKDCSAKLKIKD